MLIFRDPSEVPKGFGPSVAAIGKFDGVHTGHRTLINRAKAAAARAGAQMVAVTFDRHPLRTLRPEACPEDLVGTTQKLRLLEDAGVEATLVLRFDDRLAAVPAPDFARTFLVDALNVSTVMIGRDFRFGQGGRGDHALLADLGQSLGYTVDLVDDIRLPDGERRVSSTWIRELLATGAVDLATRLLGRAPSIVGKLDTRIGRSTGDATRELVTDLEGYMPAAGLYSGFMTEESRSAKTKPGFPVTISVEATATIRDRRRYSVRIQSLGESTVDLLGRRVEIRFTEQLRAGSAVDLPARLYPACLDAALIVSDGDSPNRSRYAPANRPKCVMPYRAAVA